MKEQKVHVIRHVFFFRQSDDRVALFFGRKVGTFILEFDLHAMKIWTSSPSFDCITVRRKGCRIFRLATSDTCFSESIQGLLNVASVATYIYINIFIYSFSLCISYQANLTNTFSKMVCLHILSISEPSKDNVNKV